MQFLVVDDEKHISRLLQVNLERAGHKVTLATNGTSAIELLQSSKFDRAIVDYGMLQPDGYGVLAFIRTFDATKSMWVGLRISEADAEEVKAREFQADWYSSDLASWQ